MHKLSRLANIIIINFYKIINNALPSYCQRTLFSRRQQHLNHFILPQVILNAYKYSFYPRTIIETGIIQINIIESIKKLEWFYLFAY